MEKHLASLVVAFSFTLSAWSQVKVLTQHNDISRTGANLSETNLTVFNVNVNQFGKLFSRTVDGQIYAQPLYVPNVTVPNKGTHNVIYVASMNNSLYAFDADDPNASAPLWQINLGPPVPYQDTTGYTDINPVIGITSTPVIDPSTNTLYCVAKTRENSNYFQRLHALDLASGQEKFGGPAVIQASVPGTGDGNVNGTVTFSPLRQLNRPGLLLLNGVIYLAFGSHGETFPFHGWVLAYNATTLQRVAVFNSTPNGGLGAIWQSGQGLVADASGYIYLMTGNGSFNYNTGGKNLGMSFVKLSTPALAVVDWFTPYNFSTLNGGDTDLGNSGPLLIPGTNLVLGGGKEGVFHLLNRSNMGHFQAGSNSQIVQNFQVTAGHIHGSPVYWNSPNQGPLVYVWSETDYLKAFKLVNGLFQTTPVATSTMPVPSGMPGAMLSLSANASTAGTGVVWASHPYNADANHATVAGILRAFDASNVTTELWNSKQNASRDDLGNFAKYCPPTVVHGKVYMATFSNRLVVYGLLGGSPANNPPTVNLTSPTQGATFTAPATITLTASASDSDGSVSKVDFYQGTVLLGTDTSSPYSLTWNNVSAGTYSLTAKATDNLGATSTSSSASITVGSGGVSLPTPWAHQDVGSVGVTGTASYSSGTFTIKGSGADIWGSADEFHYVYQPLSGDGQIVARVATQQNTDAWAKAGVMIRETLGASSVHALVAITPGNGSAFQCRPNTGGISTHTVGSTVTAPYWLKLVRSGNSFSAYQSSNGTSWALMGTDTISMTNNVYIGLAVSSHNDPVLGTVTLDSVNVTGGSGNNPPSISLTSPTNGASFTAPANITLNANASDSGGSVSKVDFYQGTVLLGTDTSSPYSLTWNNVSAGTYSLTAKATDNLGATSTSSSATITVSAAGNKPPAVTLTSPVNGATFAAPATISITASASDSDGTVSKVDFYSGSTLLGTDTASPYSFTWSNVKSGVYTFTAKATDNVGASTSSSAVTITVR